MKLGIASDHRGIKLKSEIIDYLNRLNIENVDFGTNSLESIDYVDYAVKLCNSLNKKEIDLGILICGTGIGMSIVANKIRGIRCARVIDEQDAFLAKNHNMANVIALKEDTKDFKRIIDAFINTPYSTEERHIRRVNKINQLD